MTAAQARRRSARGPLAVLAAAGTAAAGALIAIPGPAATAAPVNELRASQARAASCFTGVRGDRAVDTRRVTATVTGIVQARLRGGGDWDLAVLDEESGAVVGGSAGYRTNELAEGFVTAGQRLVVQGCRYGGRASSARLSIEFFADPRTETEGSTAQLVRVATPTRADKTRLQRLGLDLTEHGTARSLDVVVYSDAERAKLRRAGFSYEVEVADLAAQSAADRRQDARYAAAVPRSDLPSGRTTYRRLFDYQLEMKQLVARYPGLVRPLTMPERSIEGRDVEGVEITRNARNVQDGKPVFFIMGVHHAREWPSSEHTIEFAYDLLTNRSTARNRRLLSGTRTVVLPHVNPDGFNVSREAPTLGETYELFDYEYKRKNCNPADSPPEYQGGTCGANPAGRLRGTDPNRNYGGFWGGAGASPIWSSDLYRGSAPFSEPETRNVRSLVSNRQVTNLITNHTFSNLVLRPPGVYAVRPPLDDPQAKALGDRMASRNGYASLYSWQLYDTTGTTEDWSFWQTGGFGYTFEIGDEGFHPAYENAVVGEYLGREPAAGAGLGGNQAAYYDMLRATADTDLHSTIQGRTAAGRIIRLHKEFTYPTSPVVQPDGSVSAPLVLEDVLDTTYRTTGGRFRIATNPSTRPYVAGRLGRDPQAPPQAGVTLANPPGIPAENQGDPLTGPNEEIPFTVGGLPQYDNESVTISIEWDSTDTDWDLYIVNAEGEIVGSSANGGTTREDAVVVAPPAGEYTAVVVNYEGGETDDWGNGTVAFANPIPTTYGPKETWTLTCETPGGRVLGSRQVYVDRGQIVEIGNPCRPGGGRKQG